MHAVGWGSTDPDNSQPAYSLQVCRARGRRHAAGPAALLMLRP